MPCNLPTVVYSRVVGFYTPVQSWNKGKRAEYDDRRNFQLNSTEKDTDKESRLRKTLQALRKQDAAESAHKEEMEQRVNAPNLGVNVGPDQHPPSSQQAL